MYPVETCDDGNNIDGDGCDKFCQLEDLYGVTWTCTKEILTQNMVGGEVVITGKTTCVDCTTNDSCVSNDETLIT